MMTEIGNNVLKRKADEIESDFKLEPDFNLESDNNNHNNNDEEQTDEQDVLESPQKKSRLSEDLDIRFLVSSKEAGAIIGKGGANINHLRKHYKSSVTVPDCPGPERVLSIVSSIETLGEILKDVIGYIDDRPQKNSEREVELRLLIHTSHAGGIIGKGGQRIRDLREQTKAAIKVFSQCCPVSTERVCAIQGNPGVVISAIKTILDIILQSPIKGPVKLYDPYNFDIYGALEYGGYTDPGPPNFRNRGPPFGGRGGGGGGGGGRMGGRRDDSRGGHWHHDQPPLPPPPDVWGSNMSRMPYNGPAERRGPPNQMYNNRWFSSDTNSRPQSSQPSQSGEAPYWSDVIPNDNNNSGSSLHSINTWSSAYPSGDPDSNFGPPGGEDPSNLVENPDGSATATITVPNNVAGAIIGKGGNRIRIVRRDSGAEIAIDSAQGPGNDRIITIKGNAYQVRMACSMLRKSIAENTRRY